MSSSTADHLLLPVPHTTEGSVADPRAAGTVESVLRASEWLDYFNERRSGA